MRKQNPKLTAIARNLRKGDSAGEKLVWSWLRDQRFSGYKFRRQHPIGEYVLDFFCNEAALNIEVDGFQHGWPENQRKDAIRDAWLNARNIKVLRFWSSHLRRDKESVRDTIWADLQKRAPRQMPAYCRPLSEKSDAADLSARSPSPQPSPAGRGRIGGRSLQDSSVGSAKEISSPRTAPSAVPSPSGRGLGRKHYS
ncbi:MAG: putative endonuclease [Verrucomicrobiales bacterium]|nr:putative endonuclease [Verrucomicrobiales bacterium]